MFEFDAKKLQSGRDPGINAPVEETSQSTSENTTAPLDGQSTTILEELGLMGAKFSVITDLHRRSIGEGRPTVRDSKCSPTS